MSKVLRSSRALRMAQFAAWVLDTLEREEEWGSETLDEISFAAKKLGLAEEDKNGMFTVTKT